MTAPAGPSSKAPPTTSRARARRGDGDRLRDEILDAAEQLLVEVGSADAVSVRQIAKLVGCTPPSIYLHFADKDELVFHVCCRRFEEFHDTITSAIADIETPSDAMLAMGRAYVAYGVEHPEAYRVLFGVMSDKIVPDDVDESTLPGMQAFELLVQTVVRGVEAGEFRAPDPVVASLGIWSTMHGLVLLMQQNHHGMFDVPGDIVTTVCQQALDGLRVR